MPTRRRPGPGPGLGPGLGVVLLSLAVAPSGSSGQDAPRRSEFARAVEPRAFRFPRDHAAHPEFRTEWWYFTGSLTDADGAVWGFQATWFRSATAFAPKRRPSPLAVRDIYFFHGALTDVARGAFHHDHIASRAGAGWASASAERPAAHVLASRMERDPDESWHLDFLVDGRRVRLRLAPSRPPLLHGLVPGLSIKGPAPGQASYYASLTRLRVEGTIERDPGGPAVAVTGGAWFDHEFGSRQLEETAVGWDWFSVALDDGTDLMLYAIRRADGESTRASSGTTRDADGRVAHLSSAEFTIEVLDTWTSPTSGSRYPSRWRLRVPGSGIDLEVRPLLPDQELVTTGTTGVTYWEGLCRFRGRIRDREVRGAGYVELVGYGGSRPADI